MVIPAGPMHLRERRAGLEKVWLIVHFSEWFRPGPTDIVHSKATETLDLKGLRYVSFEQAAAAVQRARGRSRSVSWEDWEVYIRLPRGRRLDRSALGTLRCRFFLGGGTTCTSASPRSSRRSCAVPLVRGLARDGPVGDVWAAPPVCPAAPRHGVEQRPLEPDPRGGVRPAEPRRRASHEPWRVHRPAAAAR